MPGSPSLIRDIAVRARAASQQLAYTTTETKNRALLAMAAALESRQEQILAENEKDLAAGRERGLSNAMLDRLTLDAGRLQAIADGVRDIAALPDPVGEVIRGVNTPNGLELRQVRTPMGVIAMVYESRPNVTVDAATLALKSGNAAIMRGGSEAVHSNRILASVLIEAAEGAGLPVDSIQMVPTQEHEVVVEMLGLSGLIDLVIPRGGERLINMVVEHARIPVVKHFRGMCHLYIDRAADAEKAVAIAVNAKAQRPSTCNSIETILVSSDSVSILYPMVEALKGAGVEVRGCERTRAVVPDIAEASEADWDTEYLDLIVSVKVVDDLSAAIAHIRDHSSGLADAIVTEDYAAARRFTTEVDSAAVYVNASTRFTDGAVFGLGAEIGITTDRIFPRGPMGLRELTSSKYVVWGDGQIR